VTAPIKLPYFTLSQESIPRFSTLAAFKAKDFNSGGNQIADYG